MPRNCATYSVNAPCLPVSGRNLKKNCAPILVSYDVEQPGTGNSGGTAAGTRDTSHAARQLSFERRAAQRKGDLPPGQGAQECGGTAQLSGGTENRSYHFAPDAGTGQLRPGSGGGPPNNHRHRFSLAAAGGPAFSGQSSFGGREGTTQGH